MSEATPIEPSLPTSTPPTTEAAQTAQVETMASGGGGGGAGGITTVEALQQQYPTVYNAMCQAIVQNGFNFINDSQQRIHDMNVETYSEGAG